MNEELELPPAFRGISFQEKKELYKYKQSHSNVEWESELMARQEQYEGNQDLERLMRMGGEDDKDDSDIEEEPRGGRRKAKEASTRASRGKRVVDSEEEESLASSDEDEGAIDESDDDDDLFDSDEENDIIKKSKSKSKSKKSKSKKESDEKSRKATRKKSRLDDYEEADAFMYGGSDDGSDDMDGGGGYARRRKMRILPKGEDSDDEFYSGVPRSLKQVSASQLEPVQMASYEDYLTVQVKRDFAIKHGNDKVFNECVKGCFVRFFKRSAAEAGEGRYLMCEILEVVKRSPYFFQDTNISIALTLTIGDSKYPKNVKLTDVSNSRITQQEFNEYVAHIKSIKAKKPTSNVKLLSKKQMSKRRENFRQITSRSITDEEVKSKIEASGVTMQSKEAIQRQIAEVHAEEPDEDKRCELLERLQKQLNSIEREEEYNKSVMLKAINKTGDLNRRNKERNANLDKEASAKRKRQAKELAAGGFNPSALENPFDRKETVPRSIWVTGGTKVKDKAEEEQKKKEQEKAALEVKKATEEAASKANKEYLMSMSSISVEEIRARVTERLGYDPLEFVGVDKRTMYLRKVCEGLPPKGSEEREKLRKQIGLKSLNHNDSSKVYSLEQWKSRDK